VERVEDAHQVVGAAVEVLGTRDGEGHPVGDPRLLRRGARRLDRGLVVVEAREGRCRVRLGEQPERRTQTAADVGHPGPGHQLCLDPVEGGDPAGHQVCPVHRLEEALGPGEQVVVVVAPPHPTVTPERLDHPFDVRCSG
jgi:hypothetical protein